MIQLLKSLFKKESRSGYAIWVGSKGAEWSKRNYGAFADEGYKKNVICYQAINKKAKAVSQIPWVLKNSRDEIIENDPFLKVVYQPNSAQSLKEWLEATVGFYSISGNIYWERVGIGSKAAEFYALRPDRMTIKTGKEGTPEKFIYKTAQEKAIWTADEQLIRHIKTFNPLDDVYGMSPIEAAAYSIDQHNESNTWLQSLLQNGASPSGALTSSEDLTDEQYKRLKAEVDEKFSGSKNAGRPLLLEGGMDWKAMGLSPQNMSIIETKYTSARDIALAMEVPPLLLNIQGDSTYSNYAEARQAFYEETVIPLAEHLIAEFNQWNEEPLRGNKMCLDLDQVPAIVEKRKSFWDMANQSTDLTINERRELKGYPPVDGGDEVYIQTSQIPLSLDESFTSDESTNPEDDAREAFGDEDADSDREQ